MIQLPCELGIDVGLPCAQDTIRQAVVAPDQVQYYFQLAQHHAVATMQQQQQQQQQQPSQQPAAQPQALPTQVAVQPQQVTTQPQAIIANTQPGQQQVITMATVRGGAGSGSLRHV